jgi:DNA-binding MarR family transcriptional regulator
VSRTRRADPRPTVDFPTGSAWDRPGFLLWHATLRWQRLVSASLRPLGLTHVQFVLLAGTLWLEKHGHQGPSQRELADHAGTDAMMTSQAVRALEKQGLLERYVDSTDGRVRRLRTTSQGRRLALRSVEAVQQLDATVFGELPAGTPLLHMLRLIADRDEAGNVLGGDAG